MSEGKDKTNLIPADVRLKAQKNFTRIPNEIIECDGLSMQAKMIWIEMWKFYFEGEGKDGQNGEIFPGMKKVSDQLNCSPTTARKYRKELEDKGLLKTVQRGRGKSNVYYLYTAKTPEQQMGDVQEQQTGDVLEQQTGVGEEDEVKEDKESNKDIDDSEEKEKLQEVFNHWVNQESTVTHRKFKDSYKSAIRARLKDGFDVDEIKEAITNYDLNNRAVNTYWSYSAWSLKQFLSRDSGGHVETFLEKPKEYIEDGDTEFKFNDGEGTKTKVEDGKKYEYTEEWGWVPAEE